MVVKEMLRKIEVKTEVKGALKSAWKKEVKEKINGQNEKEVRGKCKEMRKGRSVDKDCWGIKRYILELSYNEAREVMKTRLHMMPLPCNYDQSDKGCKLCDEMKNIDTEHYMHCKGTTYIRRKWFKDYDEMTWSDNITMVKMSKYLRQVLLK